MLRIRIRGIVILSFSTSCEDRKQKHQFYILVSLFIVRVVAVVVVLCSCCQERYFIWGENFVSAISESDVYIYIYIYIYK